MHYGHTYTNKLGRFNEADRRAIPDDFKEVLKETGITDNTIVSVIDEEP